MGAASSSAPIDFLLIPVAPAAVPVEAPSVCGPLDFALRLRELEEQNTRLLARARELEEQNTLLSARVRSEACSVCFGELGPLDYAIIPCGHVFCLTDAVHSLESGFCFLCCEPATTTLRLYGL